MQKEEAVKIARSLARSGHPIMAMDSQTNFGWCLLVSNRHMYWNPFELPEPMLTAYKRFLARNRPKADK